MWWKKHKWKVIVPVAIVAVLAAAFWYGGSAPGLQGWTVEKQNSLSSQTNPQKELEESKEKDPDDKMPERAEAADAEDTEGADILEPVSDAADEDRTEGMDTEQPLTDASEPLEGEIPAEGLESRPGGLEGCMTADEKIEAAAALAGGCSPGVMAGDRKYSEAGGMVIDPVTGKDKYLTDPVPEGKPLPVEPQDAAISETAYTCTISISCATILNHMDWLDPEKVELVPEDGWILEPTEVTFYEGESVFNVLQRTCKQQGIHMEFENTPMYNSAYIEGIHNLYEFDCGELSGWMYKVNEWFPNYGCSRYQLKAGDVVCWEYTCDLGVDIGGFYSTGG